MNKNGFTLIELSIVIVIAGILLFGATSIISITTNNARIQATNDTLEAIERALRLHYLTVNRLPCRSVFGLALDDNNFGLENCASTTEGDVPTRTLNLPDSYMLDGWGNRIFYKASTACDSSTGWSNGSCAAGIEIQDNTGASNRTTEAAYVLVSYGKNGLGGYSRNGTANAATTEPYENENSDGDAIFRDDFIRDWEGTETGSGTANDGTYFDDIVVWKVPTQISYED